MKKEWKRSQNATMIFWRKSERKGREASKGEEVCGERRKARKRDEHLSTLGGANLHRHSHPLQGSLSFLDIFHQVVMVLFQAVTIIFSLMAITLVVLLSTLGKCQQETQFNTGTNRCYCDAFAFTSGGSFCSHVSALRLIAHNLAQSVVHSIKCRRRKSSFTFAVFHTHGEAVSWNEYSTVHLTCGEKWQTSV